MENSKLLNILVISFSLVIFVSPPTAYGWGHEGHVAVCRIAQARLSKAALVTVKKLLPAYAMGDLGIMCPWADQQRLRYPWSLSLHFINTPDHVCSFTYARDCQDRSGAKDRCLAGAVNNYTSQLQGYRNKNQKYNLTEALLFLSHFVGDIHQPLHVGFKTDRGGNTIKVKWFTRTTQLHHVWDTDIIEKARGGGANAANLFIKAMETTSERMGNLPDSNMSRFVRHSTKHEYAQESSKEACGSAYNGVQSGSMLAANYFKTRLPVVQQRLAQAGVRLAATLNAIFK